MNVNTRIIDMDVLIPEQVVKNKDDSYTILLNARLSHEQQLKAYSHAMKHIRGDDFNKENTSEIEFDAHSA